MWELSHRASAGLLFMGSLVNNINGNFNSVIFQYKVDSRSMSFGLGFIGRTQSTFSSFTIGVDNTFTSD